MEKYEKPVMMLEEIVDEICTATAAYEPVPNTVPNIVSKTAMVSGETVITVTNNNYNPVGTYVPNS